MILFLDKLFSVSGHILSDVRLVWSFIFLNFLITVTGSTFSVALFAKNRIDKESFRSAESMALRAVFLFLCYSFFAPKVYYVGISYCVLTVYALCSFAAGFFLLFTKRERQICLHLVRKK